MVRILPCHHFRSQRIGRCDEAVGVAVAGDAVIVALDHQVSIYGRSEHSGHLSLSPEAKSPSPLNITPERGESPGILGPGFIDAGGTHDIGTAFVYKKIPIGTFDLTHGGRPRSRSGASSIESVESDTELRLTHSFSTIDRIDSISYNEKGKYILCLEKREASAHSNTSSVRAYFHWEKNHGTKPMRARIAGLVSPTGAEPEEDSLQMVEIPLTSPATAVASCNLTGHIACLSAESIINLFLFRAKEAAGRLKVHYFDFDRIHAIELPGFVPEKIYFVADYLACMSSYKVHVFRVKKEEHSENQGPIFTEPVNKKNIMSMPTFFAGYKMSPKSIGKDQQSEQTTRNFNTVVFDSKNESVKVHLNAIVRDNRKRRSPSALITEEFCDEIVSNKTKVIFSAKQPGICVEDVLRVASVSPTGGSTSSSASSANQRFQQIGLFPIRIKDNLGGIALMIATGKEGLLYHLPCKKGSTVARVTSYPLTAPLVSFTFDSLFFHALTETGLETYTCRSLFNTIQDTEGLKRFKNDCPFSEESPSLVGIRPFLKVRYMASNDRNLCLLACPSNQNATKGSVSNEEQVMTIYSLELPDIDMIYEDIIRTAQLRSESSPESYFTLICEAHTLLRLHINAHPGSEFAFIQRYRETCKLIGLEYFKSSWSNNLSTVTSTSGAISDAPATPSSNFPSTSSSSEFSFSDYSSLNISEDLINKGVTYLNMAKCDLQEIFSPENSAWLKELRYIPGFVRLIEMAFSEIPTDDGNLETHRISPTLAPILVEFLSNNGAHILVDLVIRVPFIRECNSHRLINILQHLTESKNFQAKETLALLLSLVTVGGVEQPTLNQVIDLLCKTKTHDLSSIISQEIILEKKGKQFFLTDLAICFTASGSPQLVTSMVVNSLKHKKITVSDVMLAFAQAVNLNSDTHLQHCITKCLTIILETYLAENCLTKLEKEHHANGLRPVVFQSAPTDVAEKGTSFSEDEKRAVQTLVRTYLSNFGSEITQNAHTNTTPNHNTSGSRNNQDQITQNHLKSTVLSANTKNGISMHTETDVLQKNQIFGKLPSFINYLLNLTAPGGNMIPQSQSLVTSSLFSSEESRENFIKLLSLLTSNLANAEGVKDLILTYLHKNSSQIQPTLNPTLHMILHILSEPTEKSINLILLKQPTTVMLYAKEMFGGSTLNWKLLVANLKKKVQANPDSVDGDVFATILESVYLHLANTLSPTDLEKVLDKETEDSIKFHGICKRVELANTYANMVITVSSDYLSNK